MGQTRSGLRGESIKALSELGELRVYIYQLEELQKRVYASGHRI